VSPDLPHDWREQVTAMVARKVALDGAMFGGGPVLSPVEQIGVYRNQYELRLYDALREELIGLRHLLGDRTRDVLWAFLDAHPSRSWTLNRVADGLVDWLRSTGAPVEQIEMAELDHAVQRGFDAAEGRAIDPADLQELPALRLQPAVSLLRLTTNVHVVRAAVLVGQDIPAVEHGRDVHLVVFRSNLRMRHWELSPAAWTVLHGLSVGLPTLDALGAVVEQGLVEPEALPVAVQGWFRDYVTNQLVEVAG
jgi:hypothetical protein